MADEAAADLAFAMEMAEQMAAAEAAEAAAATEVSPKKGSIARVQEGIHSKNKIIDIYTYIYIGIYIIPYVIHPMTYTIEII